MKKGNNLIAPVLPIPMIWIAACSAGSSRIKLHRLQFYLRDDGGKIAASNVSAAFLIADDFLHRRPHRGFVPILLQKSEIARC